MPFEGYDLQVVDYLLKPIPFERFMKTVANAMELVNYRQQMSGGQDQPSEYIFVRSDYQMVKVGFSGMLYIEGLKDYVKIYCGPSVIFSHQNLKSIESKLPADQFLRIHKSYIISISKITSVQKSAVRIGDKEIPVGETYKDQLIHLLNQYIDNIDSPSISVIDRILDPEDVKRHKKKEAFLTASSFT